MATGGNEGEKPTTSTNQEQTTTKNDEGKQEEEKIYQMGEEVVVDEVKWKLVDARDLGSVLKASDSKYPSLSEDKTASGKFVEVTVMVENLGKEMKSVSNLDLMDDQNREFKPAPDASDWIPEDKSLFMLSNLNPNVPFEFIDIYEVPTDAKGFKLKVGDLKLLGDEEALISLGF